MIFPKISSEHWKPYLKLVYRRRGHRPLVSPICIFPRGREAEHQPEGGAVVAPVVLGRAAHGAAVVAQPPLVDHETSGGVVGDAGSLQVHWGARQPAHQSQVHTGICGSENIDRKCI